MKILRPASLRSNFIGSYKKKSVVKSPRDLTLTVNVEVYCCMLRVLESCASLHSSLIICINLNQGKCNCGDEIKTLPRVRIELTTFRL